MINDATRAAYDALEKEMRELAVLGSCASLLGWDEETYMPPAGRAHRGEQKAAVIGLVHERLTAPRVGEWIAAAEGADWLAEDGAAAANLREWRRAYDKSVKLPLALVKAYSRAVTASRGAWQEARRNNDFQSFLPTMSETLKLTMERADAIGYESERYDALLDAYEPYMKTGQIETLFADMRPALVSLVERIAAAPRRPDTSILKRSFPADRQKPFVTEAVRQIGFTLDAGRLDVTTHPFCTRIGPGDVRILTRYDENFFNMAFFGCMHEAGHGLYERQLPAERYGQPVGVAASLGVHESQSRTWENLVGRSRAYWEYQYPNLQKAFPESLGGVSVDDFVFAINAVEPSFIRVEADEVTYNLHVMVRFELELAMVRGDLALADLPGAWNEKFKSYLGITPPSDAEGCLQDVHWGAGLIGYFATYTLGNMYASQFFARAQEELGDQHANFRKGKFDDFRIWLKESIHTHGFRYKAAELVEKVTGRPPSSKDMLEYMTSKFESLYGLA